MDRKTFFEKIAKLGICTCAFAGLLPQTGEASVAGQDAKSVETLTREKEFVLNWLSDLLEAMDKFLDRDMQVKLVEQCGKACFNRFQFKKDIAIAGKGDLGKLLEAYKNNFGIERDGDFVHIYYGGGKCFCAAAIGRPCKPNDIHCECTRMTHQTIFETALERPVKVDIVESIRRGGGNCHFRVHLT